MKKGGMIMGDNAVYEKMYYKMFNDYIDMQKQFLAMAEHMKQMQIECEEMFMSEPEEEETAL